MNFCVDFGAEDAGRLTPFKDDKPKDTENSPFEASSVLVVKASPLIQNGKLIGTVTHVLVNDPTRGYGIFIENMLSEAEKIK